MADQDKNFMKRALELARGGLGLTSPNPMVGAVLVSAGRIVGEGYHRYDRLRHAESYAIEMARAVSRGATLYCSLEPCCHHGRTPPCTDSLVDAGIGRAVVATPDPNPLVNGKGIEQMREAGIAVEVGLLGNEARRLNESYFKFIRSGVPFVHIVEVIEQGSNLAQGWKPSADFLELAKGYDAVMLGGLAADGAVLEHFFRQERHRPLVLMGTPAAIERAGVQSLSVGRAAHVIALSHEESNGGRALNSTLRALGEMFVTSLLLLRGPLDAFEPSRGSAGDKVTYVVDGAGAKPGVPAFASRLAAVELSNTGDHTEITGYPRHGDGREKN